METVVKKWFRDKNSGYLDNGGGADILVHKADLIGCQFLKVGATVEFECHLNGDVLIAKKVKLSKKKKNTHQQNSNNNSKKFRFGVMT